MMVLEMVSRKDFLNELDENGIKTLRVQATTRGFVGGDELHRQIGEIVFTATYEEHLIRYTEVTYMLHSEDSGLMDKEKKALEDVGALEKELTEMGFDVKKGIWIIEG